MLGTLRATREKESRPVWGAWIEILVLSSLLWSTLSRPVWGAWIEISMTKIWLSWKSSRPVWGAWIEIGYSTADRQHPYVAPRMGRVD